MPALLLGGNMRVIIYDEKGLREEVRLAKQICEDDENITVYYVDLKTCTIKAKEFKKVLLASIYVKVWEGENDY